MWYDGPVEKQVEFQGLTYIVQGYAKYIARDCTGDVWAYEYKPKYDYDSGNWECLGGHRCDPAILAKQVKFPVECEQIE